MSVSTDNSLAIVAENGVQPVEMFNGWLEMIYDWADANRVLLGNYSLISFKS